jgi:hypothetical protein
VSLDKSIEDKKKKRDDRIKDRGEGEIREKRAERKTRRTEMGIKRNKNGRGERKTVTRRRQ